MSEGQALSVGTFGRCGQASAKFNKLVDLSRVDLVC